MPGRPASALATAAFPSLPSLPRPGKTKAKRCVPQQGRPPRAARADEPPRRCLARAGKEAYTAVDVADAHTM